MCDVRKELTKEINDMKEVFEIYREIQRANIDNINTINKTIKTFRYVLIFLVFVVTVSLGVLVYNSFIKVDKSRSVIGTDNIYIEENSLQDGSNIKVNGRKAQDIKKRTSHKNGIKQ